jgi:hypothetical protein
MLLMTAVVAPVDHKNVVPPVAVKLAEEPAHMVWLPGRISQLGRLLTVSVLLQELEHPCALVTVTLYVPAAVMLLMTAVVAPVDHRKVVPPEAVKLAELPAHMVWLPGAMLQTGSGFTVSVLLQELEHPAALVTVTLYVPAAVMLLITAVVAPVDHKNEVPPVAVKLAEVPEHIVWLPGRISQTGSGFTVSVLLHELVHPWALVTVTLYVPAAVMLLMTAVVAPVDHMNEVPPEAVKLAELPVHIVWLPGAMLQTGLGSTVSITLQVLLHWLAFATVTLYVPAALTLQITAVVAPVDHKKVKSPVPPEAVKQVDVPWQIVLSPVILQVGNPPNGPPTKSSSEAVIDW